MTLLERVRTRVRRAWRSLLARLGANTPGWDGPPVDEGHATYRAQYEALLPTLKHLPRGVHHERAFERRNALLFLAELLDGLHNYGDDPIMPPGIRRQVVRETQRLATFGDVGRPSAWGRFVGFLAPMLPYVAVAGVLLSVTGWGGAIFNGWRADRMEVQRDRAVEVARDNAEAAARWRERSEHYRQGLVDAANVARQAADALQAERERQARAAARERRRQREIQNVIAGSPDAPDWRLRDDPADAGGSAAPSP